MQVSTDRKLGKRATSKWILLYVQYLNSTYNIIFVRTILRASQKHFFAHFPEHSKRTPKTSLVLGFLTINYKYK